MVVKRCEAASKASEPKCFTFEFITHFLLWFFLVKGGEWSSPNLAVFHAFKQMFFTGIFIIKLYFGSQNRDGEYDF